MSKTPANKKQTHKSSSSENQNSNTPKSQMNEPPIESIQNEKNKGVNTIDQSGSNARNPQPFLVKMESSTGWKRSEIISVCGILISAFLFFMTIQTFRKTSRSVEISENVMAFNRDATIAQSRAYLILDTFYLSKITSDSIAETKYIIKNIGKTPAYDIQFETAIDFKTNESMVDTSYFSKKFLDTISRNVIPPDRILVGLAPGFKIHPNHYLNYTNRSAKYYVLAKITYKDIYGITRQSFSFMYRNIYEPFYTLCSTKNEIF